MAVQHPSNEVLLSAASVWEASIKAERGRLQMPVAILEAAADAGFAELAISSSHGVRAAGLPFHHHDPFDRMLVAQALEDDLVLVTRDPLVRQYDVPTLLA